MRRGEGIAEFVGVKGAADAGDVLGGVEIEMNLAETELGHGWWFPFSYGSARLGYSQD